MRVAEGSERVAAVDCGTNTIKLLVARAEAGGLVEDLVRETRMIRLGEGVDSTGRLSEGALGRAFAAIDEYAALIAPPGVSRIRFCATLVSAPAALM